MPTPHPTPNPVKTCSTFTLKGFSIRNAGGGSLRSRGLDIDDGRRTPATGGRRRGGRGPQVAIVGLQSGLDSHSLIQSNKGRQRESDQRKQPGKAARWAGPFRLVLALHVGKVR